MKKRIAKKVGFFRRSINFVLDSLGVWIFVYIAAMIVMYSLQFMLTQISSEFSIFQVSQHTKIEVGKAIFALTFPIAGCLLLVGHPFRTEYVNR